MTDAPSKPLPVRMILAAAMLAAMLLWPSDLCALEKTDANGVKMSAEEWSKAMSDSLLAIRKSPEVDVVILAYRRGCSLDARNLELHAAYMDRMLRLGVLHMAYEPAQALAKIQPENVTVQAVLAHMYCVKGDMPAALKATLAVLKATPQDPSALYNFGQLVAWYEMDPNGPKIEGGLKRDIDAAREKCKHNRTYETAYGRGRGVYDKQGQIAHKYDKQIRALAAAVADAQSQLDSRQSKVQATFGQKSAEEEKVAKLQQELAATEDAYNRAGSDADRSRLQGEGRRIRKDLAAAQDAARQQTGQLGATAGGRDALLADLQKKKEQLGALQAERKRALGSPDSDWRWDPPTLDGQAITVVTRIEGSQLVLPPGAEEEAAKMLQFAELFAVNGFNNLAREKLNEIIRNYGPTDAARRAEELLKKLPAK